MCVCVRACVRACARVRACVRACVFVCVKTTCNPSLQYESFLVSRIECEEPAVWINVTHTIKEAIDEAFIFVVCYHMYVSQLN